MNIVSQFVFISRESFKKVSEMDQLPVHRILNSTNLLLNPEIHPFGNGNVKMAFSIKANCSSKPKLYSQIVKEMASSDTAILESKYNNVLLFRKE